MRTFDAGTSPCQPDSALLPAPHGVLMDQALNTDAKEASSRHSGCAFSGNSRCTIISHRMLSGARLMYCGRGLDRTPCEACGEREWDRRALKGLLEFVRVVVSIFGLRFDPLNWP